MNATRYVCLLAVALSVAACNGNAELVDGNAASADQLTPTGLPSGAKDIANERVARDDMANPVSLDDSVLTPSPMPAPTEPVPAEPEPTQPPVVEDAGTPVPTEPAPTEPPVTEPPPVVDAGTPPPPPPPPVVDAGMPVDPNAGWTSIPQGNARFTFPQGQTGPGATGAASVYGISGARRYRIKYEVMPEGANFDFRAGGKLPGLGGGTAPTGGSQDVAGYSARLMWNHGGRLSFYFYRVTGGVGGIDTGGYGTHWMWDADATLVPGQWNSIELDVDMDTGVTVGYLNGVEKARQNLSYLWTTTDKLVFSAFFGGQGAAYEPSKNEAMSFRNMFIKAN